MAFQNFVQESEYIFVLSEVEVQALVVDKPCRIYKI
jgi:hypothetical protein